MIEILQLDGLDAARRNALRATQVLEAGGMVLFPSLPFELTASERTFLDPGLLTRSKNISLDPATGGLAGARVQGKAAVGLSAMIGRFSERADEVLGALTPAYGPALQKRRTSFRPGAVADRALSRRKDDRRLHIDAFPANPVQGRRILRVFANVNPAGEPRLWEVGEEDFKIFAGRFSQRLRGRSWSRGWLQRLGLTKGRRTAYDQAMLTLHDAAKLDDGFQAEAPKRRVSFAAGSMWVVYTDSTLHGALQGQHALEQTYLLPVEAMADETKAPLRVLERLTQRRLV